MLTLSLYLVLPVVLVVLGLPLLVQRVPPNDAYGYRTARVMNAPELWYRVNRFLGGTMLIAGVVAGALAVAGLAGQGAARFPGHIIALQVGLVLAAFAVTWVYAQVVQRGVAQPAGASAERRASPLQPVLALLIPVVGFALSVPLILNMVPPNPLCGYRTIPVMRSPALWHQANHFLGWAMCAASLGAGLLAIPVLHPARDATRRRPLLWQSALLLAAVALTWGYVRTL